MEIIQRCVKSGLVDGKEMAADGTYLPANVSKDSWIDTEVETELSILLSNRGHECIGSDTYWHMMRLHKIWTEGAFSVLKRKHSLSKVRKRGIPAVTEECLLSAMALNP